MYQITIPLNMLLLPNPIYLYLYHVKMITQIEHIHMKDHKESMALFSSQLLPLSPNPLHHGLHHVTVVI